MTKIIQISDPHIVPFGQLAYGRVDTATPLAECVNTINRMLPVIGPVDMAIVTGDLTDFGTAEEYQRFRDIMAPLEIPYRAIPGNHDNCDVMRSGFSDQEWMPEAGPVNWICEFADIALIGLDSSVAGKSYGHLSDTTITYLQKHLDALQGKPVIVATHHPPFLTGKQKMDIQNLRESSVFKDILSAYQGELKLICGHVHRNIVTLFGDVICQIAPGTSHAVTMDQRVDAPNCLTIEPGGFLLHETRGNLVTHHIPIGQFDGPWLFYPDDK
ncbi:3',5'-cyclic adenosine monophosphate phosphodiesterase CpdA [Roseovarius litorisediminis]|uniref:3',5'-cyclic adenosine monophosphate phosphodiesterase CpdA n=1 Tax=Roseovarius litorisediminis TaxID=1312363 RepID=A0A1Y5TC82_9RHOB|nr:phosphodiesterase [Roseovarius litorisediminis]SLN60656.1 3',5'-cyclic adenosine monophosphate phosphodiesterase CpdA [Roseovarius litorisediminis]